MAGGPEEQYKIWRDGQLVNWRDANIHVMSHVVHYGSGVFEGVRAYDTPKGPAIFRLRDHMKRLRDSCKIYRMPIKFTVEELCQACVDTVAANPFRAAYIRPIVIRGGESFGVVAKNPPIETFIIARPASTYLGEEGLTKGVDVCVSSWRRSAPDTFPALAKASGNYLSGQLAKMEAIQNGYVEGIMLDSFGFISEGSGENLFLVRDGELFTTPLSAAILHGITRDSIIKLAGDMGIRAHVDTLPREALYTADEIFFTGTAAEVTPIRSVDGIQIGEGKPGPVTMKLQSEYMGIACGQIPDHYSWLTVVGG